VQQRPAKADDLNLFEIAQHALKSDFSSCTDLEFQGACFWLVCKTFWCDVETSPWIKHYTPDVVVTTYDQKGASPFKESNTFTKLLSSLLGSKANGGEMQSEHSNTRQQSNVTYRLADVYGSPAAWTLNSWLSEYYVACEPGSTILQPYFVSSSNPLFWYSGAVDSVVNIDEIVVGNKYIGERRDGARPELIKTKPFWGHLYPRVGVVQGHDHYRASSVIAARAVDSVISGRYDIYNTSLDGRKGSYYEPANQFETHTSTYGKFQMLSPKKESGCHILGDENFKLKSESDGFSDRRSVNGDYAWHYWRRYKCCKKPSGGSFLYKVTW
jgi:integrating conjugative element protein (TIGR03756 family)